VRAPLGADQDGGAAYVRQRIVHESGEVVPASADRVGVGQTCRAASRTSMHDLLPAVAAEPDMRVSDLIRHFPRVEKTCIGVAQQHAVVRRARSPSCVSLELH